MNNNPPCMPGNLNLTRFFLRHIKKIFFKAICILAINGSIIPVLPATAQRAMIDSLKKTISTLNGKQRIDCLNHLSQIYSYLDADSAQQYAKNAFQQAETINYLRGKVMSLNNEARIAGRGRHDFLRQERISLQVLNLCSDAKDEELKSDAYMNLLLAVFCQNYFDRCNRVCDTVIQLAEAGGDKKRLGEGITIRGSVNFETGHYAESFDNFNAALKIFRDINDSYNAAILLAKIGDLYRLAGDQQAALNFYYQSLRYTKGVSLQWYPLVDLGDTYYSLETADTTQNIDESYLHAIKSLTIRNDHNVIPAIRTGELFIASKEYQKAIEILTGEMKTLPQNGNKSRQMRLLLDLARAYEGNNDHKNVLVCANELLTSARTQKARQYIRDACKLKYMVFDAMHRTDSAFFYYRQYTVMKDSVSLEEFGKKLAIYKAAAENKKKETQIELLSNEKLINEQQLRLSEQDLKSGSLVKNILIGGVLLLLLLGFIIFRNIILKQKNEASRRQIAENELTMQQLESEKSKSEFQRQVTEFEMQALRAQMNPHFIFNSLNSINRFILQNDKAQASQYLNKFSRLVRLMLQNSESSLVELRNELEALELYLELESVRFKYHFRFEITIGVDIDVSELMVPPLIIQPYVENAVWHGLMHKEEVGHLQINLYKEADMLCCTITDDGIGRKRASELKSKSASPHKSMGMKITAQRMAMLQKENLPAAQIKIADRILPDGSCGGTEVLLKIPVNYD